MQKKKKQPIHLKIIHFCLLYKTCIFPNHFGSEKKPIGNKYIFLSKLWDAAKEKPIEDLAHRRKENRSK